MITFRDFLNHGYKEYKPHRGDRMCQKVVRTADKKKAYFLNIYEWDHRGLGINNIAYEAQVELYQSEDVWFTISLHDCADKTIDEIEAFIANVYVRLGCIPDIHNND